MGKSPSHVMVIYLNDGYLIMVNVMVDIMLYELRCTFC